jgi:phosphotransferase system  glucose/maltose/N-acetylglucosamine-specific IIC component
MPLSERIRIDAGRSYLVSLAARVVAAIFLVIFTLFITNGNADTSISNDNKNDFKNPNHQTMSNDYILVATNKNIKRDGH